MKIVRSNYNPFAELEALAEQFNRVLQTTRRDEEVANDIAFVPAVNTREASDAYYIEVELPGVKKEDINIDINDNTLTISGERKVKEEHKEDTFYKVESYYGRFERSFALPEDVDVEKIEAEFKDGILEIKIPKIVKVENKPKRIEIK
jgi:HSP20 family protein